MVRSESEERKAAADKRGLRPARIAGSIVSAALISPGVWSMANRVYSGRTSKLGGADILLTGDPAVAAGAMLVVLGLLPLAFWFRTPRGAGWWASICMLAFVALLMLVIRG